MHITFLGGGNMASALIGGLLARGFAADALQVIECSAEAAAQLAGRYGVRTITAPDEASIACDALVLAVKPQHMHEALAPLAGRLDQQLVVSIAAGLRMADLSRWLGGHTRIVRSMPNTPALIGAGIAGLCADPSVDEHGRHVAERILGAVGHFVWLPDESQMDAVTALSGSGPAYVFSFIEALAGAGQALGLDPATAGRLALDTVLGAARLAAQSHEDPATLRTRVTSKGGTTEAALAVLAEGGLDTLLARALAAAAARGAELGDALGRD